MDLKGFMEEIDLGLKESEGFGWKEVAIYPGNAVSKHRGRKRIRSSE